MSSPIFPSPRPLALALAIAIALAMPAHAAAQTNPLPPAGDNNATSAEAAPPSVPDPAGTPEQLSGIEVQGTLSEDNGQEIYVDERRNSANVTEAISAEQIARTGDSDAASTLKRVTGLTVVDGKFVFVRGLGDRYSSVLLNGAQLPSPDPTRRVLPLDLFPVDLLDGIVVQKSFSPDLPAEFGGGTVQLRTRVLPQDFIARLEFSSGAVEGAGLGQGLTYNGGASDFTGYDSVRGLPADLAAATANGQTLRPQSPTNPDGASAAELERFGEALAGDYTVSRRRLKPNFGLSGALGDRFQIGENAELGVLGSFRYHNGWQDLNETRRRFAVLGNGDLVKTSELDFDRTLQNIELSAFGLIGLDLGANHRLKSTSLMLRSSEDQAQVATGFPEDPEDISRFTELEYIENQLLAEQIAGEHRFPALADLNLNWQYTLAEASRESPNTRNFRFDRDNRTGVFSLARRSDSNQTDFDDLTDSSDDFSLALKLPLMLNDDSSLDLNAGGGILRRDRDSSIRRFNFIAVGADANDPDLTTGRPLDEIFAPELIGPNGFELRENTRPTDNYTASQDLDAAFASADLNWHGKYRLSAGFRFEDNRQDVSTFALGLPGQTPLRTVLDNQDWLPSVSFTWVLAENDQIRASAARSVSRPEFRELSPAPFTDPLLDLETIGNPDLQQSDISHYDLRWEHYFSYSESLSVGAFLKNFDLPIERIQVPGTGNLLSFANAESAQNYGFEADYLSGLGVLDERLDNFYTAANFSWIESSIELGAANDIQTNSSRSLQGQSKYVVNLQLGHKTDEGRSDATLLYNVSGRRISEVGIFGAPDIYEQPFDALDFNWRYRISAGWTFKFKLRNLLDSRVEFKQGAETTREYRPGRSISLGIEWRPGA